MNTSSFLEGSVGLLDGAGDKWVDAFPSGGVNGPESTQKSMVKLFRLYDIYG